MTAYRDLAFFHQSRHSLVQPPPKRGVGSQNQGHRHRPSLFRRDLLKLHNSIRSDFSSKMPLKEHSKALSASLADAKLVPGVAASLIPEDFKPTTKLDVTFDGTAVKLGNLFRTSQCRLAPSIRFSKEV